MKKTVWILACSLMLAAAMSSCQKEQKKWSKLYGYTQENIVGQYTHSQEPDAFADLTENDNAHLCPDASVSINATSEQNISFVLSCPDHTFQKSFSGRPTVMSNAFLINMSSGWSGLKRYVLSATVLKNAQDDIRLEGYVSEDHYEKVFNTEAEHYDTAFVYSVKYYFDVIKN